MYTKFLLTILTILSFMAVAYCKFAEPQTVEPFAGLVGFMPFKGVVQPTEVTQNGCQDTYQWNASNNHYGGEAIVGPPVTNPFENPQQVAKAGQNVQKAMGVNESYVVPNQQQSTDGLNNPGNIQEGYTGPDNFYTVPGTFQSEIAPRFMNEGFGADITYNFPEVDHMAADPLDPLSLANQVENFEQQKQENFENVETKFAQVHEPVALPRSFDGPARENFESDNAPNPSGATPQYKTYDRLIYAPAMSRTYFSGDPIRGDLPIMPDPGQCGWFKSQYANPATGLQAGALSVLFGGFNPTAEVVANHSAPAGTNGPQSNASIKPSSQTYGQKQAKLFGLGNLDNQVNGAGQIEVGIVGM